MSTKLFINAFSSLFNQNKDRSIVRGDSHLFFNKLLWKSPKLSKMVQNAIKPQLWYKAVQW